MVLTHGNILAHHRWLVLAGLPCPRMEICKLANNTLEHVQEHTGRCDSSTELLRSGILLKSILHPVVYPKRPRVGYDHLSRISRCYQRSAINCQYNTWHLYLAVRALRHRYMD